MSKHTKFERLIAAVRAASSNTDDFRPMIDEWSVIDHQYDPECKSTCICGKTHLAHVYTISNHETMQTLYPIGSECIRHFDDNRLYGEARELGNKWQREQRAKQRAKEQAEREQMAAEERAQRERLAAEAWERDRPRREAEEAARLEAMGERVMTHGKFQGRTFAWVAKHHKWYIDFCRENARRQELADLVSYAEEH